MVVSYYVVAYHSKILFNLMMRIGYMASTV